MGWFPILGLLLSSLLSEIRWHASRAWRAICSLCLRAKKKPQAQPRALTVHVFMMSLLRATSRSIHGFGGHGIRHHVGI